MSTVSEVSPEIKAQIDAMSHREMAHAWRFMDWKSPLFEGENGIYFDKVFREKGGMTPAISKAMGWS